MWAPVSEEDQVLLILAGLVLEIYPTITVFTSRNDSYNVKAAGALLLVSASRALQQSVFLESPLSCCYALIKAPE